MRPLLQVKNLSKSFGTLPVIQHVSFDIPSGEVIGLTGATGSGKSVLVMLLAGLYAPDEGSIYFQNKKLIYPFIAQTLGISIIHQRPPMADHFDVVDNIFLGNEIGKNFRLGLLRRLDEDAMYRKASELLNELGMDVNSLKDEVYNLTGEQRQMIAIARVLTKPVKLVIIDEPTVSLSYPNQQRLLGLIQRWRREGASVLFSSNNLDHLFAVSDRIIVLNQGRITANLFTDQTNREEVVEKLLGVKNNRDATTTFWDYESYDHIRENAERLRYHQMLLEKDLAAEGTLNRQLADQLAEQLQALDKANVALREAQRRLLSEREEERKHLARELHDQIIQDLLSINYEIEEMGTEEKLSQKTEESLQSIQQGIRDLVDNLRNICRDLRPPTIDNLGLGAALQSYTQDWSGRTGIQINIHLDDHLGRLPEETELSIFRIIQEGLNNVWRHAQAKNVEIILKHTSPRSLMVTISDDGLGLDEDYDLITLANNGHYGLLGISERVALLGGRFHLQRSPEGGSLLLVEVPHPRVVATN
jgi:signal transduction histidine kinase